jgi:hypothetical protein
VRGVKEGGVWRHVVAAVGITVTFLRVFVVLVMLVPHARADAGAGSGPGEPWVYVGQPGDSFPGGPAGGGGILTCRLYEGGHLGETGPVLFGPPVTDPVVGERYLLFCTDADGHAVVLRAIVYDPAAFASAGSLAAQAYKQLPLVYPDPHAAPPPGRDHVVGVPTWFWVPEDEWTTRTATATIPRLSATVRARPDHTVWDFGDGTRIVCAGPGVPWTAAADAGDPPCAHAYAHDSAGRPGGTYEVSVQVVWTVSWSATDGSGGALPDVWRGTKFPLRVVSVQAVVAH